VSGADGDDGRPAGGPRESARQQEVRRRYREFIRTHHPDRGGDPDEFQAGLAALRREMAAADRADRPVVFVHRPRGLAAWWARWQERLARRRRPPRVE
jgi:hypothetical protein